jgi:hypothetical protein
MVLSPLSNPLSTYHCLKVKQQKLHYSVFGYNVFSDMACGELD